MNVMTARWFTLASLCLFSVGCSGSSAGLGADPGHDGGAKGHALHFAANLLQHEGELSFMTPSVSIIKVPAENIAGKPYMVASFPAGFSPGNDPAIHHSWGAVPADLKIRYSTPATYQDGPYDMVLVVYAGTPITDAIRAAPAHEAPAAKGGDLATFTADMSAVRPGDPSIPPGVVRLNVEGANGEVTVENKTPTDPSQIAAALINTVMIIP
jgi:hypothetical protein